MTTAAAPPPARPVSPLRRVLLALRDVQPGATRLDDIADRLGMERDEVEAMVEYWISRSKLTVQSIGRSCPAGGCGSCPVSRGIAAECRTIRSPELLAIIPNRDG